VKPASDAAVTDRNRQDTDGLFI